MFKRARCLVTAVLGPCRCSSNRWATLLAIFYLLERLTRPTAGWLFMSYTGISSALFLSLPLLSGKRLPASDVTTQGLSATVFPHSYEKNKQFTLSLTQSRLHPEFLNVALYVLRWYRSFWCFDSSEMVESIGLDNGLRVKLCRRCLRHTVRGAAYCSRCKPWPWC